MAPPGPVPARSTRRGSSEKTRAGNPCRTGASPAPSPTSRTALAKRVSESTSRSTLRPSTRANHSATAVATWADRIRTTAGASLVAATTTLRRSPSGPSASSTSSRTSRPRSPTSPTTQTSAPEPRARRPRSEDFPAPGPAKRPIRCPSARVANPSTARTPVAKGRPSRGRSSGPGAARSTSHAASPAGRGRPSMGLPSPSRTRPRSPRPTRISSRRPVLRTMAPGAAARASPSGSRTASSPRSATTSARTAPDRSDDSISTCSCSAAPAPVQRSRKGVTSRSRPFRTSGRAARTACRARSSAFIAPPPRWRAAAPRAGNGTVRPRPPRRPPRSPRPARGPGRR